MAAVVEVKGRFFLGLTEVVNFRVLRVTNAAIFSFLCKGCEVSGEASVGDNGKHPVFVR